MKSLSLLLSLLLLAAPLQTQIVQGSFFGRNHRHDLHHPSSLTARESSYCGPHHMPCSVAEPCCNNGTCHTTSMESCPISLGCDPRHSHLDSCFPLPACLNKNDRFKDPKLLIPKKAFTGDPSQANWVSDFDHIAPYAKIDRRNHQLLLRTRRDLVKTQSGGGFGATVSSTRWNKYGIFSAKFRSGSTGPGIVTAFLLSNPALGEEISFELTGKDPKQVVTNYYRRVPATTPDHHHHSHAHTHRGDVVLHPNRPHSRLVSHEETHALKKDTTKNDLVYKIEWNERMIRWSVDGKVIRTVHAKDVESQGGLPENPMQVQLTIWDAGYSPETMDWAGGKTQYGDDNLDEYVATVSSVEISCQSTKEGKKPWPGHDATKRLKAAEALARKTSKGGRHDGKSFLEIALLTLIKWTCVLLSIICGAAYLTEPKTRSTVRG